MTQEQKQLLLKDLCGRLPYGIFVKENRKSLDDGPTIYTFDYHPCIDNCKPYLRPMSSITGEEKEEIRLYFRKELDELKGKPNDEQFIIGFCQDAIALDWFNANHFDYRGLIKKGLALPAPEGMYNN